MPIANDPDVSLPEPKGLTQAPIRHFRKPLFALSILGIACVLLMAVSLPGSAQRTYSIEFRVPAYVQSANLVCQEGDSLVLAESYSATDFFSFDVDEPGPIRISWQGIPQEVRQRIRYSSARFYGVICKDIHGIWTMHRSQETYVKSPLMFAMPDVTELAIAEDGQILDNHTVLRLFGPGLLKAIDTHAKLALFLTRAQRLFEADWEILKIDGYAQEIAVININSTRSDDPTLTNLLAHSKDLATNVGHVRGRDHAKELSVIQSLADSGIE